MNTTQTRLNVFIQTLAEIGLALTLSPRGDIIGVYIANPQKGVNLGAFSALFQMSIKIHTGYQWLMGDMVNIGLGIGEDFAHYLPANDHTLQKWSSICNKYPAEDRAIPLPFSHYEEVAYLPRAQRQNLLAQAYEQQWTVQELRLARSHEQSGRASGLQFVVMTWQENATAERLYQLGQIDRAKYDELITAYGDDYTFTVETRVVGTK